MLIYEGAFIHGRLMPAEITCLGLTATAMNSVQLNDDISFGDTSVGWRVRVNENKNTRSTGS